MQSEGWDHEEEIANEDLDLEVNKELQREQQRDEEEALEAERLCLERELKQVCHGPDFQSNQAQSRVLLNMSKTQT